MKYVTYYFSEIKLHSLIILRLNHVDLTKHYLKIYFILLLGEMIKKQIIIEELYIVFLIFIHTNVYVS